MRWYLTAVFSATVVIGTQLPSYAQDLNAGMGGGMSITIGSGQRSGDWGLSFPLVYKSNPWSSKGPYFGISIIRHKDSDGGSRGQTDRTFLIPVGVAFFSNSGITTSPHITFGYASDDYDTWGLGGYLCGEASQLGIGSKVGCKEDWTLAYGAGLDLSYGFVVLGANWLQGAGWYFSAGYRLWGL